ncbi:MAG: 30S ribosomal protein S18 [Bdellovibrionales bacterium]|nr:30S ribosomal protein S18 [Bdellovibrionales bacterium]
MIYELSLVTKANLGETEVQTIVDLVKSTVKNDGGEVVVEDNWGVKTFAQPTSEGVEKGNYLYFLYSAGNETNVELNRKFRINESVLKSMIFNLGYEKDQAVLVKSYKTPYSKTFNGSVVDSIEEDDERSRRKFARSTNCWFSKNKIKANWKDPATYSWLVNEFGKIAPARVSGISRKHQRYITSTVKVARQLGLISHLSNRIAE